MASAKEFMNSYVALERVLKEKGKSVADFENILKEKEAGKLKICRVMRNFMVHEDSAFLQPSDKQVEFVNNLTYKLSDGEKPAFKAMMPLSKALTLESTIGDALTLCKKKSPLSSEKIVVFDKKGNVAGVFDSRTLVSAILTGKTVGIKSSTLLKNIEINLDKNVSKICKLTPVSEIKDVSLVTDGEKILGYIS